VPASATGAADDADPWSGGAPHRLDDGEFEVMFVVEPDPHRGDDGTSAAPGLGPDLRAALTARLGALGTSVAVVGGPDGWHVHVHTDDPAAAVAAGDLGERSQVVVRRLVPPAGTDGLGAVVGTGAPGLVADLARTGALVLVHVGRPVTAREVRRAVVDRGEPHVVVLPGSPVAHAAAGEAVEAATGPGAEVDVLDADDDARVVVALTADPGAGSGPARVAAMRTALAGVRTAVVDRPDPDAVLAAARALLDDGGDVVTVLRGAGLEAVVPGDLLLEALTAGLATSHPDAEVVVLAAGQATPAAVVAVEDAVEDA
jgi:hypothetical protein